MIDLSKPKRKDTRKNRKRPSRAKNIPASPLTQPGSYIYKSSYILLCYASMRSRMKDREWFTTADYCKFQLERFPLKNISANAVTLAKNGYLVKRPLPRTNINNGAMHRYEFKITPLGLHALQVFGRKRRDEEKKIHADHLKNLARPNED